MRHQSTLTALALTAGLTLAGCSSSSSDTGQAAGTTGSSASPSPSVPASTSASASAPASPSAAEPTGSAEATGSPEPTPGPATTAPAPAESAATAQAPEPTRPPAAVAPPSEPQPEHPYLEDMPGGGTPLWGDTPPQHAFTYEEAYAAWRNGMAYYDAFCLNYTPVTPAGVSQCEGILYGTVDGITGEYIGPR